jgi:hypothetical protein
MLAVTIMAITTLGLGNLVKSDEHPWNLMQLSILVWLLL